MAAPTAHEAFFTFQSQGYSGEMRVRSFTGLEGISDLFIFGVELGVRDPDIDLNAVVGARAQLDLIHAGGARSIFGIVSRFEEGVSGATFTPYTAQLVPTVWLLTQRYGSRIFQNMDVRTIIDKVLKSAGVQSDYYRFALQGGYVTREYCVQYRETDWNFAARLMEEEGIFYFFDHQDGKDVLVMADSADANAPIDGEASVRYRDRNTLVEQEEFIHDFRYAQQIRPGKVSLKDYNFQKPTLALLKDQSASHHVPLEVYDYPGIYTDDGPGGSLTRIRLEAAQARRLQGQGQSICRRFVPGYRFKLTDFPRRSFNGEYLLTSVQHEGSQPLGQDESGGTFRYGNHFTAIPSAVPFRPTRLTPKPVVEGSQTAVVTGPAGEEIYVDKYGRVKVQFPWDREGQKNDKSSCWIRVSQLWAGEGWGAMFIPRIGHEVIVDFLEGDPDRPIITGRVYNGDNMPPYALDSEKVKSTIKSNSTKGGGGYNEYRFDDTKGSEEIFQHGQKDLTIVTENDKNQSTGHDETLKIGHDRSKTVGNDETTTVSANRTEEVGKNEKITIGVDRTEKVGSNENITIGASRTESVGTTEKITIGTDRTESVGGKESVTISGNRVHDIAGNDSLGVKGTRSATIKGDDMSTVSGAMFLNVEEKMSVSVDKTMDASAKDSMTITSDQDITLKTGDASIVLQKDGTISIKGKDISIEGSGAINVKASKDIVMKGQKILQN